MGVLVAVAAIWAVVGALTGLTVGILGVEGAVAAGVDVGVAPLVGARPLMVLFAGLLMYGTMDEARGMLGDGRRDLLAAVDADRDGAPTGDTDDATALPEQTRRDFAAAVRRLAAAAGVAAPTPAVHPAGTPLCYTVHHDDDVVLVVSRGLLAALPADEREAVLAHEVAHLANGDNRVMTWAVAPLVVAEEVHRSLEDDESWELLARATVLASRLGTGLFSRGRELAADRAAARLTGDPGALAAALERLDGTLGDPPPEDLRDHVHARDALNVLPALDPDRDGDGGPLATHPPTAQRVERLRELEREQATA